MGSQEQLLELISDHSKPLLIFDYDGTLVEIAPSEFGVRLSPEQIQILNELARFSKDSEKLKAKGFESLELAIVTGRSLPNLKNLLEDQLDPAYMLFGTHGAEKMEELHDRPHGKELDEIKELYLREENIVPEEKSTAIAFHYKNNPHPHEIREKFFKMAEPYMDIFRIQEGHFIFEFVPKDINKGIAIDYLIEKFPNHLPVYFGDDLTDNFAFKRVNHFQGLSVQMDTRLQESHACHNLANPMELYNLLSLLLD